MISHEPPQTRLLYVITDLEMGGVPLHLVRLARHIQALGNAVTVASLVPAGPVAGLLADAGIDVHSCDGRGGWDVRVLRRLRAIVQRTKPDLIHAMLFHANLAARYAAWVSGFPRDRVLCEIQTVEVERRWHLLVDRLTHRGCRLTIGNSPSVIEHLSRFAAIPRDRLRLVRGGIDPKPFETAAAADRACIGIPHDGFLILWVGRMDPVKGLNHLIEAFAQLPADRKAHLVLAGNGPLRTRLETQAARLSLSKRIHFLGPRRDVPSLLKAADLFVFPSRTEGLPNALLEAMAAGRAIVATDVPGCRDLIRHGDTGFLVPYGDTSALRDAIVKLLNHPVLVSRLGAKARADVSAHWRLEDMLRAYAGLYAEVLAST